MSLVFLDVGANNGNTFDLFLAKTNQYNGAKIFCFEPSPRHWPRLLQMADHYRNQYDITLCPFGLGGDIDGFLPFYEKEEPSGDSFMKEYFVNAGTRKLLCAQFDIYDFIVHQVLLPPRDNDMIHIKLDCEGAEYAILNRLLSIDWIWKRIDRLLVEFHEGEPTPGEAQRLTDDCAKRGKAIEPWNL